MRRLLTPALPLALAACTVGPNYAGPPAVAPNAAAFVRAQDPALTVTPGLARWWETLNDPVLDQLVTDALAHAPDIAAAQARIREARAQLVQARAAAYPGISGSATYVHTELPGNILSSTSSSSSSTSTSTGNSNFDFYNLGGTASWEPDLWGGTRRQVEATRDTIAQRQDDLADAQVSLTAQVAQAYINLRDADLRVWLNARQSALESRSLALVRQRLAAGTASQLDVERSQTQLSNTNAQAVPLSAQVAAYKDALAVLTGRAPGAIDPLVAVPANTMPPAPPLPPAQVPIGDPATLIAHRPDVRAAERQLAAATATIGAKQASLLPTLKFTGLFGLGGTSPGDVVNPSDFAAILMPQLSWPLLDWGKTKATVHQAEAQRDEADAQYRKQVLSALQDAEDSLARFGATRQQLTNLAQSQRSAANAARLNAQRFAAGTSTLIDQLDTERQDLSAQVAVEQAAAQLTLDYIAVQKSLGLGWVDAPPEKDPPLRATSWGQK